jgi:hypothetical protein
MLINVVALYINDWYSESVRFGLIQVIFGLAWCEQVRPKGGNIFNLNQNYHTNLTSDLYYKSFTIVIYDSNDSSHYYNSMIMIISYAPNLTLALASVIN